MKAHKYQSYLLLLLSTLMLSACQQSDNSQAEAKKADTPTAVDVVTLTAQTVTLTRNLPARTTAYRKAEVRPQVNGIIEKRLFEEGAEVDAGQQLYQIEPALYQAAVANARAELSRAKAALTTAKARESRYKNLMADKAISRQEYDDALASYQQAQAEVQVQQAALSSAETNLSYTRVNAPISGRIGKSNVTEGALVAAQQSGILATIHQLDPIYVDIAQPSKQLLQLRQHQAKQENSATVTLTLEDGSQYPLSGKLQFAEVNVNSTTGDIVLRAIMPNPDHLLLPGMFVRAEIIEGVKSHAVLAPQAGISFDREGQATALIVNAESRVEIRSLSLDRAIGNNWLVSSGLNPGDQLIIAGLQKIAPGSSVMIDHNTQQLSASGE